jgi:hypothetical protein
MGEEPLGERWRKFKLSINQSGRRIYWFLNRLSPAVYTVVLLAALVASAIVCMSMWIIARQRLNAPETNDLSLFGALSSFISIAIKSVVAPQGISKEEVNFISEYATIFIFLLNMVAILFSSLYLFKERHRIRKSAPYFENRFWAKDVEINDVAVPVMQRYYRAASEIKIISGDFDWLFLPPQSQLSLILNDLTAKGKAELMSYKSPMSVLAAWKKCPTSSASREIFEKIRFQCPLEIKGSLILTRSGARSFIFLSERNDETLGSIIDHEKRLFSIFEYHDGGVGRPMIARWEAVFAYFSARRSSHGAAYTEERKNALGDRWWNENRLPT